MISNVRKLKSRSIWGFFTRPKSFAMASEVLQKPVRKGKGRERQLNIREKRRCRGHSGSPKSDAKRSGSSASKGTRAQCSERHAEINLLCGKIKKTADSLVKALGK